MNIALKIFWKKKKLLKTRFMKWSDIYFQRFESTWPTTIINYPEKFEFWKRKRREFARKQEEREKEG